MKKNVVGVVLTRAGHYPEHELTLKNVENMLETPVIGVVPEDKAVKSALSLRESVIYAHPKSKSALSYKKLAADLLGRKFDPEFEGVEEEKKPGRWTRFFQKLGF